MAASLKVAILHLLLVLLLTGANVTMARPSHGSVSNFDAPLIMTDDSDIVLDVGGTLNLTCRDTEKVVWLASQYDLVYDNYTERYDEGHERPYITNLVIENVNYTNVGYYYCIHNTTENKNKTEWSPSDANASSVYVFVRDLTHLVTKESETLIHYPVVGKNFTLPCKPTFPEVKVTLDKTQGTFDPREGFTVLITGDEDFITCHASYLGEEIDKFFVLSHVEDDRHTETMVPPKVNISDYWLKNEIMENQEGVKYFEVEEGSSFNITCDYPHDTTSPAKTLKWTYPEAFKTNTSGTHLIDRIVKIRKSSTKTLMLLDAQVEDSGKYTCIASNGVVKSKDTVYIHVMPHDYKHVVLELEDSDMEVHLEEEFIVRVLSASYPMPTFIWRRGDEVLANTSAPKQGSDIHRLDFKDYSEGHLFMTLDSPSIKDINTHTLEGVIIENGIVRASDKVQLNLTMPVDPVVPTIRFRVNGKDYKDKMLPHHQDFQLICESIGYPKPEINLEFKQCYNKDNCTEFKDVNLYEERVNFLKKTHQNQADKSVTNATTVWEGKTNVQGRFRCSAKNKGEGRQKTEDFPITDGGFQPLSLNLSVNGKWETIDKSKEETVLQGDNITILCIGNKILTSVPITWKLNNSPFDANSPLNKSALLEKYETDFSYISKIYIEEVSLEEKFLTFTCNSDGAKDTITLELDVKPTRKPKWITNGKPLQDHNLKEMGNLTLSCPATGDPKPEIKWYKDRKLLQDSAQTNRKHINGSTISFNYLKTSDSGEYKCVAISRAGMISDTATVYVTDPDALLSIDIFIIVGVLSGILVMLSIFLCIKTYKDRKRAYNLRLADQKMFEEGDPQNLNPELGLEEQAELLPYDTKYEVSRDSIIFDKLLGAGAFGRVYRATALNLIPGQPRSTVAVKMMKSRTDCAQLKALRSEVKIMIHIGRHINIVNLLGACSKELASKGELLLLVEYCKYGNILDFMRRHRKDFVDQINEYDRIDVSLTEARIRQRVESGSRTSRGLKYAHLSFYQGSVAYTPGQMHDDLSQQTSVWVEPSSPTGSTGTNGHHEVFRTRTMSNSSGPHVASDMSIISYESSNGGSDTYIGSRVVGSNAPTFCTKDLLCWAFQIAKGMEYLAFKKVLHGDLAARNILLAEDNVVKISDFGLAKDIYKNDNYRKKSKTPVPWKWLAAECFRDGVFSTQSDIWSYGIVLWEIFSLGQSPYPGVEFDDSFITRLEKGVRPEQPKFATKDLYRIMLDCWNIEPMERPSFSKLESILGMMLGETEKQHYLELNTPYQTENSTSTFMTFLQSPDYSAKIKERNLNVDQDGYEMPFSPSPLGAVALPQGHDSIRSPRLTPLQMPYLQNGDPVNGFIVNEAGDSYIPMNSPSRLSHTTQVFNFDQETVASMTKRDSELQSYGEDFSNHHNMQEDNYLSMQSTPTEKSPNLIAPNVAIPLRNKLLRTASQMEKHDSGLYSPTANIQCNPHYMIMDSFPRTDQDNYLTKDECDSYRDSKHNYINIQADKALFPPFQKDYISDAKCNGEYANLLESEQCRGRTISEASSGLGSISEESPPEYRSKPDSYKSSAMESVTEEAVCA